MKKFRPTITHKTINSNFQFKSWFYTWEMWCTIHYTYNRNLTALAAYDILVLSYSVRTKFWQATHQTILLCSASFRYGNSMLWSTFRYISSFKLFAWSVLKIDMSRYNLTYNRYMQNARCLIINIFFKKKTTENALYDSLPVVVLTMTDFFLFVSPTLCINIIYSSNFTYRNIIK